VVVHVFFLVVHVCIACRLAGNSQVSIAKSIQHARIIVMRVRIFPGQENQVCLSASGTGRIGRQWLCMFVSLADSQETAGSASQNQYNMPGLLSCVSGFFQAKKTKCI
jgi:hypothetical protein